jgi:hypothetical protein
MTHPTISCERFNEQLAEFFERAVTEPMRAAMESHAVKCDDCGPLLANLRRLRIDAANLPELAPSRDLWSGIADRIEAPVLSLHGARASRRRIWTNPIFVSLAAAGLVAITATITHKLDGGRVDGLTGGRQAAGARTTTPVKVAPPAVASAPESSAVQPPNHLAESAVHPSASPPVHPASNKPSAEQTYDREIARLLVVYNQRRPQLDSSTVAVVRKNLKIIDDAIAQTRVALRRDPASQFLMESLNDAFDTKVQLLRKVAMLPSGT